MTSTPQAKSVLQAKSALQAKSVSATTKTKRLNLALQGGGAHGAFTWGVIDYLLEDGSIDIGWISGTSAGAVNGVALAAGLAKDGPNGARVALAGLWTGVVAASVPDMVKMNPFLAKSWSGMPHGGALAQLMTLFSPYDFNPLGIDPLRKVLEAHIDIKGLQAVDGPELLIAATDIATGRARLFRRHDMTIDAVLASACLPTLQQAVEIDGRAYWDGGFSANPELLTLAAESPVEDTLIVQLSPLILDDRPTSARDINGHVNHLMFNRPFVDQLETIEVLRRLDQSQAADWFPAFWPKAGRTGKLTREQRVARHRFHLLDAGRFTASLSAESKIKPDGAILAQLFNAGRSEAAKWLGRSGGDIGVKDTAEIARRLET